MLKPLWWLLVVMSVSQSVSAQTLADRLKAAQDGRVRLSFAARPGCAPTELMGISPGHSTDEWQPDCRPRLVRVALRLTHHRVHSVKPTLAAAGFLTPPW